MIFNYPVLESLVAFAIMFLIGYLCGNKSRENGPNAASRGEAHT
jgi:hypothetical protein